MTTRPAPSTRTPAQIADTIRAGLREHAQPDKAEAMQAYLKSDLPCLGTYTANRNRVVKNALSDVDLDRPTWEAIIDDLWTDPAHREERHAAIDVILHRSAKPWRDTTALSLMRELIIDGAWWDLVDGIGKAVNDVVDRHRPAATPVIRAWATDADLWVRRSAIIAQLRSKDATDLDLLAHAIDANVDDEDFFIRKAIGWALRQHARVDADWVRAFVDARRDRLSKLSVREATKHL